MSKHLTLHDPIALYLKKLIDLSDSELRIYEEHGCIYLKSLASLFRVTAYDDPMDVTRFCVDDIESDHIAFVSSTDSPADQASGRHVHHLSRDIPALLFAPQDSVEAYFSGLIFPAPL